MSKPLAVLLLIAVGCSTSADVPVSEGQREPLVSSPTASPSVSESSERLSALAIGDLAPPLRLGGFLKGELFTSFEPGKFYVVEFSATWCGPCRAAIPHLTELQKKYPDVTFLSVYVREDDQDAPRQFIEEMGDRIGYRVAVDDVPLGEQSEKGLMWQTWMEAAEIRGIPALFVVDRDGRIVAITDPRVFAEPLAKIVAGQWDIEAAAIRFQKRVIEDRRDREFRRRLDAVLKPPPSEDMLKILNDLKAEYPKDQFEEEATSIVWASYRRFLEPDGNEELALVAANEVLAFAEGRPAQYAASGLNGVAWTIVDPERPQLASEALLRLALETARRADEFSNETSSEIADTLARVLHLHGNTRLAYRAQQRAVRLALAEPEPDLHTVAELRGRLSEYAATLGLEVLDEVQP